MSNWISIYKNTPKAECCVDLWFIYGDFEGIITNCFFDNNLGIFWKWDPACKIKLSLGDSGISHWMPVAQPPDLTKDLSL